MDVTTIFDLEFAPERKRPLEPKPRLNIHNFGSICDFMISDSLNLNVARWF
jgi:hypothetical protein